MALAIPGFIQHFDIQDLVKCIAPRSILLVSATNDKGSQDADKIVQQARGAFESLLAGDQLEHYREDGGHALTQSRFEYIPSWITSKSHL